MSAITVPLAVAPTPNALVAAVANGIVPVEALAVPIDLGFSPAVQGLMVDLTESARKLNEIAFQGVFIDMSSAANNLIFGVPMTGQTIFAKGGTQGFYALFVPMPARVTAVLQSPATAAIAIPIILYNTVVSPLVWTV